MHTLKIIIILLLIHSHVQGQDQALHGSWYSPDLDMINFSSNYWKLENRKGANQGFTICERKENHFRLMHEYYDSRDSNKIKTRYDDNYDLVLKEQTNAYIVLQPTSASSKEFFEDRQEIKFFRQRYLLDTTVHFEKLIFHSQRYVMTGFTPDCTIELDNRGNLKYSRQTGSAPVKNYVARVKNTDLSWLNGILQTCQLNKLNWHTGFCSHYGSSELTIYYSGKTKHFNSSCPPPEVIASLLSFLDDVESKVTLKPIAGALETGK